MSSQPVNTGSLCQALPHAPSAGPLAGLGGRGTAFLKAVADRLLQLANWTRSVRFIKYREALRQRRSLDRALWEAQLVLGKRMYEAGIDDGETGAQIAILDEELRHAQVVRASTCELERERLLLFVQLAAAALAEDGPLPGAEAEYARARSLQAALHDCQA